MATLSLSPFSFRYRPSDAFQLEAPRLSIPSPSVVGLLGLNGSGKSTFLKILARRLEPEGFSCRLGEEELTELPLSAFARHAAYLPQHIPFFPPYTIEETLYHARYPHNPRLQEEKGEIQKIRHYMDTFQLNPFRGKVLSNLSGGQQKAVMLASIFAQETPLILLDEPFNSLDIPHQWELGEIIQSSLQQNQLIFISSHNLELLFQYTDRVLFFQEGKVPGVYPTAKIPENPSTLEETLQCKVIIEKGQVTKKTRFTYLP